METKTVESRLREARKRAGLTLAELAVRAKVSPGSLSNHENHALPLAPMARWRIAAALGIPSLELFPGSDPLPWERTTAEDLALQKHRQDQAELCRLVPGHVAPPGLFDDGEAIP